MVRDSGQTQVSENGGLETQIHLETKANKETNLQARHSLKMELPPARCCFAVLSLCMNELLALHTHGYDISLVMQVLGGRLLT